MYQIPPRKWPGFLPPQLFTKRDHAERLLISSLNGCTACSFHFFSCHRHPLAETGLVPSATSSLKQRGRETQWIYHRHSSSKTRQDQDTKQPTSHGLGQAGPQGVSETSGGSIPALLAKQRGFTTSVVQMERPRHRSINVTLPTVGAKDQFWKAQPYSSTMPRRVVGPFSWRRALRAS